MGPEIEHEIGIRKAELAEFLAARYVDQSLVLGFTTIVQSKFQAWLLADTAKFCQLHEEAGNKQVDTAQFELIDLLQQLWQFFHYPIVKMYQRRHAELLDALVKSLENGRANGEGDGQGQARNGKKERKSGKNKGTKGFRAVEMRKLNESFSKFLKLAREFYNFFLREFAKHPNPQIPSGFLEEFGISIPEDSNLQASDLHSSLSYAIFKCLLGLGNLARSEAYCSANYVAPGMSVSAYYRHQKRALSGEKGTHELYIHPMFCYFKCIRLLPTIHEPYNHMGVIYSSLGQSSEAVFWFLRAQSTRDLNTTMPRYNMAALFSKPWLHEAYLSAVRNPGSSAAKDAILLRIMGDYFFPKAFQRPLYVQKVQTDFLSVAFTEANLTDMSRHVIDQLTMLFSFYCLPDGENSGFRDFLTQYIVAYLGAVSSFDVTENNIDGVLKVLRLILAFTRKKSFQSTLCPHLLSALNSLLDFDTEETKEKILETFNENKLPIRTHYFDEDVHFKDYTPIGCQFKDFNDHHLFKSGNVNLLFGGTFYCKDRDIPDFLDNDAVNRISKDAELGNREALQSAIATECTRYENILRLRAVVAMTRKICGSAIRVNTKGDAFEAEKTDETSKKAKTEKKEKKEKKEEKKKKEKRETKERKTGETFSKPPPKLAPSSLEEIELMILGHAPKIAKAESDITDMVKTFVGEEKQTAETNPEKEGITDGFGKSPFSILPRQRPETLPSQIASQNQTSSQPQIPSKSQIQNQIPNQTTISGQSQTPSQNQIPSQTPQMPLQMPTQMYPQYAVPPEAYYGNTYPQENGYSQNYPQYQNYSQVQGYGTGPFMAQGYPMQAPYPYVMAPGHYPPMPMQGHPQNQWNANMQYKQ